MHTFKLKIFKYFKEEYSFKNRTNLVTFVKVLVFYLLLNKYLIHVYQILFCYILWCQEVLHHYCLRQSLVLTLATYVQFYFLISRDDICHLNPHWFRVWITNLRSCIICKVKNINLIYCKKYVIGVNVKQHGIKNRSLQNSFK